MSALVPNRFLFDFEFPLPFRDPRPVIDGALSDWSDDDLLPRLGDVDGLADFADVWACWNETGLSIACRVSRKRKPLRCNPKTFWKGDNLRLCTDMRDARSNKRATRFCQQFYFLPTGGGRNGKEAAAGVHPIPRALEPAPNLGAGRIEVASRVTKSGYSLEAHVPAACLSGFDPVEHPRIGFYYMLEDADHGQQYLTVGDDLNWHVDPSTWPTAVLERDRPTRRRREIRKPVADRKAASPSRRGGAGRSKTKT